MKKILAFMLIGTLLLALLSACSPMLYDESNIHLLYDRSWILGKSRDTIEARYGKFHREYIHTDGEDMACYKVNSRHYDSYFLDPTNIHDSYFIVFNAENIAVDAYFAETSRGG